MTLTQIILLQDDWMCNYTAKGRVATDEGYSAIPRGNEEALKEAVATVGPISVAIDAGHLSFQHYVSGISPS